MSSAEKPGHEEDSRENQGEPRSGSNWDDPLELS
jgi:hypothetical protein